MLELLYSRGVNNWQRLDLCVKGRRVVVVVVVFVVVMDEGFNGSLDVRQKRALVGIFIEEGRGGRGWW